MRGQPRTERVAQQRGEIERQVLYPLLDRESGHPVLPASSLKGVLRATAERILRTVTPLDRSPTLPPLADSPFVHDLGRLRKRLEVKPGAGGDKERIELLQRLPRNAIADSELADWAAWNEPPAAVYALLSPASQLFAEAVEGPWQRWLDEVAAEQGEADATA